MKAKILLIEDEDCLRNALLLVIAEEYEVIGVSSAEEALEIFRKNTFDIAITDICLPKMSGLDLIGHLLRQEPSLGIIAISANNDIKTAVEAIKRGAIDFLLKPFDLETLMNILKTSIVRKAAITKKPNDSNNPIIANSLVMQNLLQQVNIVSPFNTTILITGETGTGKELLAHNIHQKSLRAKQPFVAINCAAIPEHLLEDELFGHVKGAFTGAHSSREGRFELANGGTLFLDEIGDMSLAIQAKLLRVLQEREFEKLGSSRTIKIDVRIIAATSANLEQKMQDGSFRPDLFYRLNVVHFTLPLLRNRKEDIPLIAEHLLVRFCGNMGLPAKYFHERASNALKSYHWPGNIRQLQNVMERTAIMTGTSTTIYLEDLPKEITQQEPASLSFEAYQKVVPLPETGLNFEEVVSSLEKDLLCQSLKKSGGNKMQAAKLLSMKRTTFVEKLKRLGID